jgi:hypothetical protein
MDAMELVKTTWVMAPIVALVSTGLVIMLRSGVTNLKSDQGLRQLACNLSQTLLLLAGWLVSILALQQLTGFRLG